MNRQQRNDLLAERSAIQEMIRATPVDELIDLRGLNARLEGVNFLLASEPVDLRKAARAKLTFRGRPVVGSQGIFAEFGLEATKAFADAIATIAASLLAPLQAMGPIPGRAANQLIISGTATGSFGFELEEFTPDCVGLEDSSSVATAIEQARSLLEGSTGTDDELADIASEMDPRAINAVKTFLDKLAMNEAVCAIETNDGRFSFNDVGQVRTAATRLGIENLSEPDTLRGAFQGALPNRRTFEFIESATRRLISGKIASSIHNPLEINNHVGKEIEVVVQKTRIGGGSPRYLLQTMPRWPD